MSETGGSSRVMTVAQMREHQDRDYYEVMFLESARFYRLAKSNAAFGEIVSKLREAMTSGRPVGVILAAPNSDVVEDVQIEHG